MKRILSILSVFALLVSLFSFAPVASAEENGSADNSVAVEQQESAVTTSSEQQAGEANQQASTETVEGEKAEAAKKEKQYKIRLRFDVEFKDDETVVPVVVAKLLDKTDKEVGQVEGTWTVEVDGQVYKTIENSKDKKIRVELPEDFSVVVVKFEGKIDGQDVKVKKKYEFTNADVEITHKEENGKDVFTATIKGVQQAQGMWYLALGTEDGEVVDEIEAEGGATFTHAFEKVKPGKYFVVAIFMGTVDDGDFVVLGNEIEFEKKASGGGEVKPPAEEPGDNQPPVLDPEETKKQIEEGKKGGKLPKTATTYPAGALAGLVLLLVGFAALKLRRA